MKPDQSLKVFLIYSEKANVSKGRQRRRHSSSGLNIVDVVNACAATAVEETAFQAAKAHAFSATLAYRRASASSGPFASGTLFCVLAGYPETTEFKHEEMLFVTHLFSSRLQPTVQRLHILTCRGEDHHTSTSYQQWHRDELGIPPCCGGGTAAPSCTQSSEQTHRGGISTQSGGWLRWKPTDSTSSEGSRQGGPCSHLLSPKCGFSNSHFSQNASQTHLVSNFLVISKSHCNGSAR